MADASTVQGVARGGYREFVLPGHPLLQELFPDPLPAAGGDATTLVEAVFAQARKRLRYDPEPGRRDFDVLGRQVAAAGGEPTRLNCINTSCVVVSCLRRAGCSAEEVYVATGTRPSPIQASLGGEFHAWIVVLREGGVLWIDPVTLEPEETTGEAILSRYKLNALFNDRDVFYLAPQMRRLLLGGKPRSGLRLYLFGRPEPQMETPMRDPEFRQLVRRLFTSGSVTADEVGDPALLEPWLAAGLLARKGRRIRPGPTMVLVPQEAERELATRIGVLLDRYLGIASAYLPRLRRAFESSVTADRWRWDEVSHAVVGGMLLDLAVGQKIEIAARVRQHHGSTVIWAFEHHWAVNSIGVSWSEGTSGDWALGQLWHAAVKRRRLQLSAAMVDLLGQVALGEPPAKTSPEELVLRHQKVLQRSDSGGRIAVPVFLPAAAEELSQVLSEGGRRLATEAVLPAMEEAGAVGWWQRCRDDEGCQHAIARLMLDYGSDRVFDAGLVPSPPAPGEVPFAWGRWLWLGRRGDALPRSLRPPEATE